MGNALKLWVLWCLLAEWSRWGNTIDVQCIARVFGVGNGVCDKSLLVCNTWRLGKVDHCIGINLLSARVGIGKKSVDTVHASERHARLVGGNVSATLETKVLPALSDRRQITLRNALGNRAVRLALANISSLRLRCASWRCGRRRLAAESGKTLAFKCS